MILWGIGGLILLAVPVIIAVRLAWQLLSVAYLAAAVGVLRCYRWWLRRKTMKGYVMLDGYRFEITALALRDGKIQIDAGRPGPLPLLEGPVTIFGEDGRGFGQADADVSLPVISVHEYAELHLAIGIDTLIAGAL